MSRLTIDKPVMQLGEMRLAADISFCVNEGEMVCLTGESGCGKTSLLSAILGFVPLAGGNISLPPHQMRRITAYVPQELNPPVEWVRDMVDLPFSLRANAHIRRDHQRMLQLWDKVGLDAVLYERRVNELSGGQRARISLVTALLTGKQLLLADEPTAALDTDTSRRVANLIREHVEHTHTAALVVSHDPAVMEVSRTVRL